MSLFYLKPPDIRKFSLLYVSLVLKKNPDIRKVSLLYERKKSFSVFPSRAVPCSDPEQLTGCLIVLTNINIRKARQLTDFVCVCVCVCVCVFEVWSRFIYRPDVTITVDRVSNISVVGSAYQECLLIIQYANFIGYRAACVASWNENDGDVISSVPIATRRICARHNYAIVRK